MTYLESMLANHPIRRSKAQKEAFRTWAIGEAEALGYTARTENNGGHHNVVIGDPDTAEMIFTAHYDTPAVSLFANRMIPRNRAAFYLRQAGMILAYMGIAAVVGVPLGLLTGVWRIGFLGWYVTYMALVLMMLIGPANRHNANDNTSGVASILTMLPLIAPEKRGKIAVIFFDDEEKGLLGSKAFAKAHPDVKANTAVINLDCVGVGDHILMMASKELREKAWFGDFTAAMVSDEQHQVHHFPLETSRGNSDQKSFKCGMGVYACRQKEPVGFVTEDIHTPRDTVCDERNIQALARRFGAYVNGR